MKDFTLQTYKLFLQALNIPGRRFLTYRDFHRAGVGNAFVLRHDVDLRKENSLDFARIQNSRGICGSYYFRVIPQSYSEGVIKEMAAMGHEIGYHYETMDTCRGDVDRAYDEFCRNLEMFRRIVTIDTICMHGSPTSKFDNRALWEKYDYHSLGLIAEPYLDVDFNKVYYLTDTGRRWDGSGVSIRDKVSSDRPVTNTDFTRRRYHSSFDLIRAFDSGDFPGSVMMTFHPQRWTDDSGLWWKELLMQNIKNQVKRFLVK